MTQHDGRDDGDDKTPLPYPWYAWFGDCFEDFSRTRFAARLLAGVIAFLILLTCWLIDYLTKYYHRH